MGPSAYNNSTTWSAAAKPFAAQVASATSIASAALIDLVETLSPMDSPTAIPSYTHSAASVHDAGAGNGSLTAALSLKHPALPILATDIAPGMIAALDARQLPNVRTHVLDSCASNPEILRSDSFSHVLSSFMLQYTYNPSGAVREMYRILRPGGVVGLANWIDVAINWPWNKACKRLDPNFEPVKHFDEAAWTTEQEVEAALMKVGFQEVRSELVRTRMQFESAEDFVNYWYNSKNPGMVKAQSGWKGDPEEVRGMFEKVVREEWGDGKNFEMCAALTVGRKEPQVQYENRKGRL